MNLVSTDVSNMVQMESDNLVLPGKGSFIKNSIIFTFFTLKQSLRYESK